MQIGGFIGNGEFTRSERHCQAFDQTAPAVSPGRHGDLLDAAAFGTAPLLDTPEPRVIP